MSRRPRPWQLPPPGPPPDLAEVTCAEQGCSTVTEVQAVHADQLRGRWRCRDHWRGTCPPPTHAQVPADDTTDRRRTRTERQQRDDARTLTGEEGRDPS